MGIPAILLLTWMHFASQAPPIEPARAQAYGAALVCDDPVFDFGTVWVGSEVEPRLEHGFRVRNEGGQRAWVRVTAYGTTACQFEIQPGETVLLRRALKAKKLIGTFEKTLSLQIRAPLNDEICGQCGREHGSTDHFALCGPSSFPRFEMPGCVEHSSDRSCEAF